jgi:ubiquinone/menaquinone biosynthesis C-methylase UbiE
VHDNARPDIVECVRLSVEQWEAYYRAGALATGPAGPDGNYDLEVRQAWAEFFSTLPDGARVLDVGTGNGVIPLIAAETAQARGIRFEIHGTDLARIDPVRDVRDGERRFKGIRFHPETATERLPFDAGSFDAVSGHYALEYSDPAAALAQVHRVLVPGGQAQFVLHHADSVLVRSAQRSMRETDFLLKDVKLYRRVHRLVTQEQVTPDTTRRITDELRQAIQATKRALEQARASGGGMVLGVTLDAAQKLLQLRKEMDAQRTGLEVDRAEAALRASWRRLNDLVAHARTAADMESLKTLAAAQGFTQIECSPQFHAGRNLVGWLLLLHRP